MINTRQLTYFQHVHTHLEISTTRLVTGKFIKELPRNPQKSMFSLLCKAIWFGQALVIPVHYQIFSLIAKFYELLEYFAKHVNDVLSIFICRLHISRNPDWQSTSNHAFPYSFTYVEEIGQ